GERGNAGGSDPRADSPADRGRGEHVRMGVDSMMEATMGARQRKLRNYLLDAPMQLRFTAVLVLATLLGAGLLGIFLARALNRLSEQAERAVEARAAAAQASHELGHAS